MTIKKEARSQKSEVRSKSQEFLFLPTSVFWLLTPALFAQQPSAVPPEQVSEWMAQGFERLSQNDAAGAEAAFHKSIEARPDLAGAHRGLGLALWRRGEEAAALRELTTATQLAPQDADTHYALGRLAWTLSSNPHLAGHGASSLSASDYQSLALRELSKAQSLRPKDYDLSMNLAEFYLDAGRAKDALTRAEDALRLAPSPEQQAAVHVVAGRAHFAIGEEDKAEAEFLAALALDPKAGEAHLGLGQLWLFQRKLAQAEQEFRRALQVSPGLAPGYVAYADALISTGHPSQARELLEKAIQLDPHDWHSQYQLATLLVDAGQAARAADLLETVAKKRPDFLPAREQLGLSLLRRGDWKGAEAQAQALIAQAPQAAEGHRVNALVLWKQRDLEGSLAECAMALASDPNSAQIMVLQALELWQLNRKKEAQAILVQAGKVQPKVIATEVLCRLILCDARDMGPVEDFVRKNRWVLTPVYSP